MLFLGLLTITSFLMLARYLLVVSGTYKDPVLASFEHYGEEKIFSPLLMLIGWALAFTYISLFWYFSTPFMFWIGLLISLPLISLWGMGLDFLKRYKNVLRKYPVWFDDLMQITDRDERRRIAYMWLFLPPSTRMLYNANDRAFFQWVEQVLLTVAQ